MYSVVCFDLAGIAKGAKKIRREAYKVSLRILRPARQNYSGLRIVAPDYPLFRDGHLTEAACTWHQHGVFHLQEGMQSLIDMKDGGSLMYVDKISSKGTWIVTTLDPDFHFGSYFMPATEKFLEGFLPWLAFGEI